MNRRNYTVHFALAASLVMLAALAGQVQRWESRRKPLAYVGERVPPRAVTVAPPAPAETFGGSAVSTRGGRSRRTATTKPLRFDSQRLT